MELNLCPFARRELERSAVRYAVTMVQDSELLLQELRGELELLERNAEIETAFLIHPELLQNFYDFNDFLGDCDRLLRDMGLEGIYQIASFHPAYQFAGTGPDDPENYSNRSPYPMLHLLREDSVERAIAGHPDIDAVPLRNIEVLNDLGGAVLRSRWEGCFHE